MKKSIQVCDMCGSIIAGPGDRFAKSVEIQAAVPYSGKNHVFHKIDVCDEDDPYEYFDGGTITLFYGGSIREGEMIDVRNREIIAVVDENHPELETTAYSVESLSSEQQRFVETASDAIEQSWKEKLDREPTFDQNV